MSYKIAVASSDGVNVDLHFGSAKVFKIYVVETKEFKFLEDRKTDVCNQENKNGCDCSGEKKSSCGSAGNVPNIEIVADCRAVVCAQIGRNVLKQLESRAISAFDISISVDEALQKIVSYFYKIDNRLYRIRN